MSTIYKFQDSEPTVTPATTLPLAASDPVLAYCGNLGRTAQTNVGSVSALATVTSVTTASLGTGTTLSPYGLSIITTTSTVGFSILPPPPAAGIYKTIMMAATATGTGYLVICGSSGVAVFTTGTSSNTIVPRQSIAFGQNSAYVDLISQSTSAWVVIGQSQTPAIAYTTTTTT